MFNPMQLETFLRRRFGPTKRQSGKHGLEIITKCPVCGKRKLSINARTGFYQCWRGCMSGHVDTLLGDTRLAKTELSMRRAAPASREVELPGDLVPLMSLDEDHQAIQYLKQRKFDPRVLDEVYGLRYCASGKRYAGGLFDTTNTIVIPVYANGLLIGWQSRLLYDPTKLDDATCANLNFIKDEDGDWVRPPKYFTMPGLDKGKVLYNFDWARRSNLVVVCEGVFDAIAVGRCAVAAFGKNITDDQANLLKAYWDLVVILLDPGDAEGDMRKLEARLLNLSVPPLYVKLEGYKDAGEAPQAEIWRQIDIAIQNQAWLADAGRTLDYYRFIV